jgi:hypothetical protein
MNNFENTNQKQVKTSKKTYLLNRWNVMTSMNNLPYFGKTIGLPIAQLMSKGENSFEEALPEALLILCHNLEETSPEVFINKLLKGVHSLDTNQQLNINEDFYDKDLEDDDLGEILELCAAVFKARYGSMLGKKGLSSFTEMGAGMHALTDL